MNAHRNVLAAPARKSGFWRQLGAAVALSPVGLYALVTAIGGRSKGQGSGRGRLMGHAVLTVLLGVLALIPVGILALGVARGLLYGFVDSGPYDTSWGGPSMAGAWLAHFGVSLPFDAAAIGLLYGLAALHRRMTAPLRGERRPVWVLPTVLLSCVAAVLFLVAFVHQLN